MGQGASTPYQTVGLCTVNAVATPTSTAIPTPTSTCSLVLSTPAPTDATCGFAGYLSRPALLADWPVSTSDINPFETCTNACLTVETCAALSFDAETLMCELYTLSVSEQKPRKSKTGSLFYDADCFEQMCAETEVVEAAKAEDEPQTYYCGDETVYLTDPEGNYTSRTYFPVALPFPMRLYGGSAMSLYMSINGYLSFSNPLMTHATPHHLPYFTHSASNLALDLPSIEGGLPERSLAAFWTEAQILNPPKSVLGALATQSMQYTVTGATGSRILTFSWRTSEANDVFSRISVDVVYQEAVPGQYSIRYESVGDEGNSAVVGAQATDASKLWTQYNNVATPITDGTALVFDSVGNTLSKVKITKRVRSVRHVEI